MNSANQMLSSIKHRKAITTKKYENALERCKGDDETLKMIEAKYKEDMDILNEEETHWINQFNDIPRGD